ncbi:hypothetical protein B0H14DRAFT_3141881 [Mycena olivaceomarginata]|nr:hypothetical protein B0H14DRAFT_3141881 [Mycena olivaceomarginata]
MPPTRGPLWEFFHRGRKRNTAHCNAYCLACIALYRPDNVPIPIDPRTCRSLVHAKWMVAAQDLSDDEDGEELQRLATTMGPSTTKFLPRILAKLFGGQSSALSRRLHVLSRGKHCSWSCWAAEHSDEELDDGELEGSGDDYDG